MEPTITQAKPTRRKRDPVYQRFLEDTGLINLYRGIDAACMEMVEAAGGDPVAYAIEVDSNGSLTDDSPIAKVADEDRAKRRQEDV